jgi:hypothetical protein
MAGALLHELVLHQRTGSHQEQCQLSGKLFELLKDSKGGTADFGFG